jgi:hypothetical protein
MTRPFPRLLVSRRFKQSFDRNVHVRFLKGSVQRDAVELGKMRMFEHSLLLLTFLYSWVPLLS